MRAISSVFIEAIFAILVGLIVLVLIFPQLYVPTWQVYGKELMRVRDRHDRFFALGPTHEEVVTDIDAYEDAQKEKEGEKGSTDEGKKKQKPRRRRHVRL